jgi:RimJ/RimL family protein N-acetyltransferase
MLEGTLVNLRAQEMDDLERNMRWLNDRAVTRTLAMRYQVSLLAEEGWMRQRTARPLNWENAVFAIETKYGEHIGNAGLHGKAVEDRVAELGIMIGEKPYWNRGYGTDAVRTLVRFGFEEMNLNRIDLHAYDFNAGGLAAYRKCDFVEEGRMREAHWSEGAYHDIVIMSVLRDEYTPSPRNP